MMPLINWMYGRNQDFCLRLVIVKLLTEYQRILGYISSKQFGFGPDFVKWVSVLMADTKSCCLLRLVIRTFCRRGWNTSGLPFFTTSLCSCGRTTCNINTTLWEHKRIELLESKKRPLGKYHKYCTLSRRFNVFFKHEQDMQQALEILAEFSTFSGLGRNRMKSEAMWLGSSTKLYWHPFWICMEEETQNSWCYFACDRCASQVEVNWTGRVDNFNRIINAWGKRNLSIVYTIKTFLISQFVYIMQALVVPDPVLTQVNTILFTFLEHCLWCFRKRRTQHDRFKTDASSVFAAVGWTVVPRGRHSISGVMFLKIFLLPLETNTCVSFRIWKVVLLNDYKWLPLTFGTMC